MSSYYLALKLRYINKTHTHIHKVEPKTLHFISVWLLQNSFLLSISRKWKLLKSKTLFTWSGGPRSSGVGLFCVPQSVKTKENNPTRPRSPTPCKQALSVSRASSQLIMRVNKPTAAYKLVQLCSKNPQGELWRIIIKTNNLTRINR